MNRGNPVNLRVGSEMQQAHGARGGGSRRGGAKPRGRNERGAWQRLAEARAERLGWEWTPACVSTERDLWKTLKEPPGNRPSGVRCSFKA